MKERWVGNASTRRKEVGVFGSVLLRCELARDGARGFGSDIGCSGMILMTRDGCRQVGIGQIGVGSVMVVTIKLPFTCIHGCITVDILHQLYQGIVEVARAPCKIRR